ncbi:unnamed protein product [marine sediment metagenome]|uniref:Uncharacterized protein n=1 Tax=marine sediment metagenome TaxID=412755 RepID=X0XE97_9ZZZZ
MASNISFNGSSPKGIDFGKKVNILHISVQDSPIGISLDNGQNYMTLPVGKHTLYIGIISKALINGSGTWQVIGSTDI